MMVPPDSDAAALQKRRLVAAVETIYQTALAPERWPAALQAIADAFDDVGAVLTYGRGDGRLGVIVSPALMAGQDDYNREWYRHDIRAMRMVDRGYRGPGDTVTDVELGLVEEHDRHPFFTQFLRKFGLLWIAGVTISPDPDIYVVLSVHRSDRKANYTPGECEMLSRLGLHAEKSLRLGMRVVEAESASLGLRDLFDRLKMGVFLLDSSRRVIFCNEAGKRSLGQAIEIRDDRLAAKSPSDRAALQAAIGDVIDPGTSAFASDPRPTLLRSPQSGRAFAVYALPLRGFRSPALEQFLLRGEVIVLTIELSAGDPADPALLRDLLGLTLGEAKVAALIAAGHSPKEASQKLGISQETGRTLLKRAFAKSGVSRQSELAALIARVSVGGAA
jgi:DNA-binding CsgD family transcriptional regulator/PAS domain-containing protein